MKEYFLVIDTETSGLPKKWDQPYDSPKNWPYVVQIAWIIYQADGNEIKRSSHYLKNGDFKINASAYQIHQINHEYLSINGEDRRQIMLKLRTDLEQYHPLIIGHFMELDFHMIDRKSVV